jgi:prepilin signal peptidase PulO-like enzyme (type II secretory pathway)
LVPNSFFIGLAAVYGLLIGSFLNALIWRVHKGKSIAEGRSICTHCKHELAPKDLIPLLSYLMLGGKCRYCSKPIGLQYPLVELATAVLFGLSYWLLEPAGLVGWGELLVWLYVLASLIFLAVYDLRWMLLPNVVMFPAIGVTLAWIGIRALLGDMPVSTLTGPLLAAAVFGFFFLGLAVIAGGRLMGLGDVKLVVLMGLLLGIQKTILALLIGFNTAAVIGVGLIILGRKKRSDYIPFGPFLVIGTIAAYLYGAPLIEWYLAVSSL